MSLLALNDVSRLPLEETVLWGVKVVMDTVKRRPVVMVWVPVIMCAFHMTLIVVQCHVKASGRQTKLVMIIKNSSNNNNEFTLSETILMTTTKFIVYQSMYRLTYQHSTIKW